MTNMVTKRNGEKEELDLNKIHKVIFWACENITGVSPSDVEMKSKIEFYDGITTKSIQRTMIRAAADLISEDTPNYQYVASRLMLFDLRKSVLGQYDPIPLKEFIDINIKRGLYDADILNWYTSEELDDADKIVKHDRDLDIAYAGMKQMVGKYLVQDRTTKTVYETPQYCYIMIALTVFRNYPKETRMKYVKSYYDNTSKFGISLPTPIMGGVRTPDRQFSSCVLIECDDTLDSIIATTGATVKYISQKAGIGLGVGKLRAVGSKVRNGKVTHTGVVPFFKMFQAAIKSCSQGGIRGGSGTLYIPFWHAEIDDILVLKNNKGVEDNRVRRVDYGIQFNGLMYERLLNNDKITLFSPHLVPDLYEAFFTNQDKFRELYLKYENDKSIVKTRVSAKELFIKFAIERFETGRIYIMNVDHANSHGAFIPELAPIRMSNLCAEIDLPTKPLQSLDDPNGEIALCTLSAINLGVIKDLKELEVHCDLAVRALDELLDIQDYPVLAARNATMDRRPLGIGVINLAYYLAKHGVSYSDPNSLRLVHETFEAISFYLIKASMNLAKEKGACPKFNETKYSKGIFPIDTYKKDIDELCDPSLNLDWDLLRTEVLNYGMRNSTLMALMPSETSAQISNATNGIEPPRALVSIKGSKESQAAQVVPEIHKLKNKYELAWDMPNNTGYLNNCGIMQKFSDQGLSVNFYYEPKRFPENKIPVDALLMDQLLAYKRGIKQVYYSNTNDGRSDDDDDCASGACKI